MRMKCAMEMLISTEQDRATAQERRKERERQELEEKRKMNEKYYNRLVSELLANFETHFKNCEINPKSFVHNVFFDSNFKTIYTNGCEGLFVYEQLEKSRYADKRKDYVRVPGVCLDYKVIEKMFDELCYEITFTSHCGGHFWVHGEGNFHSGTVLAIKINPKCFE